LSRDARYARRLVQWDFDYLVACEVAEHTAVARARRVQMLVGALVVLLALVGVGWWKQGLFLEQYYWRLKMGPSVLTAEQEKEKAATRGSDFTECAVGCPTMVVVPAGKFMMGSPVSEKGLDYDEDPQR
jgi:formylglycine-generating enzyme required for sulfatase activity